jgi:hypothetical protein
MTEICNVALPVHALLAVRVRLKPVCNEGHFIHVVETVSRPYLSSHCSGVTEISHMALTGDALCAVQLRLT